MKAHPKIQSIVEAIGNNKIPVAIHDINSILKKADARNQLGPETLETLQLLRGLCQARTEQFGDAKKALMDYLKANAKTTSIDPDMQIWINFIGGILGYHDELHKFLEPLQPKNAKDEKTLLNHMGLVVKSYNFKNAQTAALKVFKDLNQPKYMLASILFQYLSIVKAPEPPKDLPKALELCCMFINSKLIGDLKITNQAVALENLLNRQVIKFYALVLSQQKKRDLLVKTLTEFPRVFEDDYENYFNYLLALYEENESDDVKVLILTRYAEIFRQNNDLNTFRLCYNLYKQFINFLYKNIPKDKISHDANIAIESAEQLAGDNLTYDFPPQASFDKLLGIFWKSLGNSYKIFGDSFREHQHYRNAVKAVLTAKLEIIRQIMITKSKDGKSINESALINDYVELLNCYTRHFVRIFTFADEIYPFLTFLPPETIEAFLVHLKEEVSQIPEKNRCIADVNYIKLRNVLKGVGYTIEDIEKEVNELIGKYTEGMTVVYDNKKIVEKGERLDNDEYLVVMIDLVIKLVDEKGIHEIDERIFSLVVKTWYIVELALDKSPYNFDLKVKLIDLYGKFCVSEKALDVYKTMDIKAVQTDTLGYFSYKTHSSLGLTESVFDYVRENIKFHVESLKESKESGIACLKHNNAERFEEFWEWDKLMQRSYFKHVSYLHFAEHELHSSLRKPVTNEEAVEIVNLNFEFFIEQIIERYNLHLTKDPRESFTFNFDVKTPQRNMVVAAYTDQQVTSIAPIDEKKVGKVHIDYLTTLNNPTVLAIKAYRLDLLYGTVQPNAEGKLERIQKALKGLKEAFGNTHLEGFFDFRQFATKTRQSSLLHTSSKEGFEYSFVKDMAEFELANVDFEIALGNLYNYWLEVILKKEEKEGEVFLKEAEIKFNFVLEQLEKSFESHRSEPWRVLITDLRKLARVLDVTFETIEIIAGGLQKVKSGLNKVTKKFANAKQCNNLYKATQTMLKGFKERIDVLFTCVGSMLSEVSDGLKKNDKYLVKDYVEEAEKLFSNELYNSSHKRKDFVTELNRSFAYLMTTFLGKIKERSSAKAGLFKALESS